MKYILCSLWLLLLCAIGVQAQQLNLLPNLSPAGGSYEDQVTVTCTFPEGCAGGKYWFNGGQIAAQVYTGPVTLERSTRLSVAGINAEGRIITDVVTYDYAIDKVTPPYVTTSPEVNSSRESFYVTQLLWNNASSTSIDVTDFKEGGSRYGQSVVWLVYEPTQETIAQSDYNGLWLSGTNAYKAYLYNNYRPEEEGAYTLHIAGGVFIVDGARYEDELELKYFVGTDAIAVPVFTPASGTYEGEIQVSIAYPQNAFYQFYQIEGQNRQIYDGPFSIANSCSIKAWGKSEDFTEETDIATADYTIVPSAAPMDVLPRPLFSRNGNTISITEAEPDAMIKYWFDNHMSSAQLYNGPFAVDRNCLISAVAYREHGISPTVDYTISHFQEEESDLGTIVLRTPEDWQNVFLTGMSPNGRFVSGYTDTGGSPMAFIWDITSGRGEFVSTQYYSRANGVSNDGTICGWRVEVDPITGEMVSTSDETLFYGYFHNGEWTRQPSGMTVMGISGDNQLFGSYNGEPATYDIKTKSLTTYPGGQGSINCVNADGSILAGQLNVNGKLTPAYWVGNAAPVLISADRECGIVSISGNGQWMLLDNASWGSYCDIAGYRYDVANARLETLTSMGAQYPSRYEWMHSVADDGTLYGVYDASMMSHDAGQGLVYTTDGIWRNVADLLTERDFAPEGLSLQSCKFVSPDQNTFIMTVFPADINPEDACPFALAVRFDAVINHAAPASVKAVQMFGLKTVKVSWEAPLMGAEGIVSYKVYRDGKLIETVGPDTFECYDHDVENNTEYLYTVIAVYADGIESEASFPFCLMVVVTGHTPARDLALRQSGIDDVNLTWQSPIISLPKLQYFNETSEFAAFGTSGYNSEWAIRLKASDISIYEGMEIRTFQFLPTGAQEGYELRLYKGTAGNRDYDAEPFYVQTIDPATLKYGTVNSILLTSPQTLPSGEDLIVAIYIEQKGNDNMLGISHEGFHAGFTDLCRVEGVHDRFVSIAEESAVTTEIVVPVGVGIGTEEMMLASMIDRYEVSDNGAVLGSTEAISYRIEHVEEGSHSFAIRARYQDGEYSEPVTITADIQKNEAAFVPVSDLQVTLGEAGKATLTWSAPLNDDRTDIHWGDLTPSEGLRYEGYPVFSVGAIYPVTLTHVYADMYEITHLFYYPTADALFRLFLDDNTETVFFDEYLTPEVGQLNIIALDQPVTIDQSTNYRFIIDVEDCPTGVAPLAFDSSNQCADGYSNLLNAGNDWMTLNDVLQIDQHPNWLMGMVIRQKDAPAMPLLGYNVVVDGTGLNERLLTDCTFTTPALTAGRHQAMVDVVYDELRTVRSLPVSFEVSANAIEQIACDGAEGLMYDLQGRRIISDKQGQQLFIMNHQKFSIR